MSTKYKTIKMVATNNKEGRTKIKKARREINDRQNNTSETIFSIILNIAGLFDLGLGITSAMFGGAISSNASYLEKCEDIYSKIYEDMTSDNDIFGVTITQEFEGTYQGKNKGYIYKADIPTYKYDRTTNA